MESMMYWGRVVVNDFLFNRLQHLITTATGIRAVDQDAASLRNAVAQRMKELGMDDPAAYLDVLERFSGSTVGEWSELAALITNRESYFFRDQGQMHLLQTRILPELIARSGNRGTLHIWSAGCSTGEEPYSLAILLSDLLRDRTDIGVDILGTDISSDTLEKARRARYNSWSFRMVDPSIVRRHFRSMGDQWELDSGIRSMVRFRTGNLIREVTAVGGPDREQFDLILCRNVFIYLEAPAIAAAVQLFAGALKPGGYLMTGHSELSGVDLHGLQTHRFNESIVYQRPETEVEVETAASAEIPTVPSIRIPSVSLAGAPKRSARKPKPAGQPESRGGLPEFHRAAPGLIEEGKYGEVIAWGEALMAEGVIDAPLFFHLATAFANRGASDKGEMLCRKALEIDPAFLPPYYLLVHIAEERGKPDEGRKLLNQILYLFPTSPAAYLLLAEIEGLPERATRLRDIALGHLDAMPADAPVDGYPGMSAGELRSLVRGQISGASI